MQYIRRGCIRALAAAALGLLGFTGLAEAREPCGEQTLPILSSDGESLLGSVVISNDDRFMYVDVHADTRSGWNIQKIQAYVGADPVPGKFSAYPLVYEDDIKAAHRFKIPLHSVNGIHECGGSTFVAVRLLAVESGFKSGAFKGSLPHLAEGHARTVYEVCCDSPAEKGCTRPETWWRVHNSYAIKPHQQIDWPAPYDEDARLCGRTWLSILKSGHAEEYGAEIWNELAKSFIAARLNQSTGASVPMQVQVAIFRAEDLLWDSCEAVAYSDRAKAISIASILRNYNTGHVGPGQCD